MTLLADIAARAGCVNVSDLRFRNICPERQEAIKKIIVSIPKGKYSEHEWRDALRFIGLTA